MSQAQKNRKRLKLLVEKMMADDEFRLDLKYIGLDITNAQIDRASDVEVMKALAMYNLFNGVYEDLINGREVELDADV